MSDHRMVRRHAVHLSDSEILLLERTLLAYAAILKIRAAATNVRTEADDTARVSSVIQAHRHCVCAVPEEGS